MKREFASLRPLAWGAGSVTRESLDDVIWCAARSEAWQNKTLLLYDLLSL